jgi:four helix bundle protein
MATIKSFEQIEAWSRARTISVELNQILLRDKVKYDYAIRDQVNRSIGSVMDNIAEGFERGGNKEFIQFLFIAKGSAGETRSQVYRMHDRNYISKEEFESLFDELDNISKMLLGLISYLKNSALKGTKFH